MACAVCRSTAWSWTTRRWGISSRRSSTSSRMTGAGAVISRHGSWRCPPTIAIKLGLYRGIREGATGTAPHPRGRARGGRHVRLARASASAKVNAISLGSGTASAERQLPRALFYQTRRSSPAFDVADDGDLDAPAHASFPPVKAEYDKAWLCHSGTRARPATAWSVPSIDELTLEEPEIMKQGGRYGVRLKASAPSIHMIRADIETTVSPHRAATRSRARTWSTICCRSSRADTSEDLAVEHLRPQLPRARQRGPAGQAQADAGGRARKAPADAGAHHQRGQRRSHLHHSLKIAKRGEIPPLFLTVCNRNVTAL